MQVEVRLQELQASLEGLRSQVVNGWEIALGRGFPARPASKALLGRELQDPHELGPLWLAKVEDRCVVLGG